MDHDEREAYQTKVDYWRNRAEELEKLVDALRLTIEVYRHQINELHRLNDHAL